jgi:hypothetical protein
MDGQSIGLIGSVIGVLGGIVGTYLGIKRVANDVQRKFMIRCSVFCWIFVLAFVALLIFLPAPWKYIIFVAYGIGFPIAIIWGNKRLVQLNENSKSA